MDTGVWKTLLTALSPLADPVDDAFKHDHLGTRGYIDAVWRKEAVIYNEHWMTGEIGRVERFRWIETRSFKSVKHKPRGRYRYA